VSGPVLEIIVFLSLNPRREFSSVQLRESIWGLGRQPITSPTFRTYMVRLRKAFGPGVVETERFRYQMTDAVTSDWIRFQASLRAGDQFAGAEAALSLVRGPVLHGCFDGKKNSPFAWAVGIANDIEDDITDVAVGLASDCLEQKDPARAASAIAHGLVCSAANLRLRLLDLRVAAAVGGAKEVGRRLEEGRAALSATFPDDVEALESAARDLGWAAVAPN
jgi:hypothetical protein